VAEVATFRANGSVVTFPGFLAAYDDIETEDAKKEDDEAKENKKLPPMSTGRHKVNVTDFHVRRPRHQATSTLSPSQPW
jgi:DNA topoisomerase IA